MSARLPAAAPLTAPLLIPIVVLAVVASCATAPDPHGGITIAPLKDKPAVTTVRRAIPPEIPGLKARAAKFGLVDISDIDNSILVDLRYTDPDNVAGTPLYPENMPCLVHKDTAAKLKNAQAFLRAHGIGLKIWDAYRPPGAHNRLWARAGGNTYVSDPASGGSNHSSGSAVDVTLVDLAGHEQQLPSGYDDFSARANFNYKGDEPQVLRNITILQRAMHRAGFRLLDTEWWHFNDKDYRSRRPVPAGALGLTLP